MKLKIYLYRLLSFIPYFKRKMYLQNIELLLSNLPTVNSIIRIYQNSVRNTPVKSLHYELNVDNNQIFKLYLTYQVANNNLIIETEGNGRVNLNDLFAIKHNLEINFLSL